MKKIKWCLLVTFALVILSVSLLKYMNTLHATHEYRISKYYRFQSIGKEKIVQEFTPTYDKLVAVELFIANVYEKTDGNICLSIVDENGKEIFFEKYEASSIPTGEFYKYEIEKKVEQGTIYRICISYDGTAEEQPQLMISERARNLIETGNMYVDNIISEYNMAVTYHYSGRTW